MDSESNKKFTRGQIGFFGCDFSFSFFYFCLTNVKVAGGVVMSASF